ncbi:MAG: hypothetical protein AB8G26_10075 [Ilumatobacter sp.]
MKVLAAEMSDPQRLRRGKQYAQDGSVTDIMIEAGAVTCEIQGSRSVPYIATLEVTRGDGMPLRRDVEGHCTCPDDANAASHACKHVLATMLAFANELLIEPELLDVWRDNGRADALESTDDSGDAARSVDDDGEPSDIGASPTLRTVTSFDPDADDEAASSRLRPRRRRVEDEVDDTIAGGGRSIFDDVEEIDADDGDPSIARRRRHLRLVRDGMERGRAERREQQERRSREPVVDPIAQLLEHPDGSALPDVSVVGVDGDVLPARAELAAVLRDAHRSLRLDWD